jgi:7,8-dihydropterin-6-yl-methyl-4-(beta-D-ribofuranosyl)aminobenzene 5'-phosphate synthase
VGVHGVGLQLERAEKMEEVKSVRITTIVDNDVWREELASCWGLSFLVESFSDDKKHSVLMDTSGSFKTFLNNASKLGLNLSVIEAVLISHWHGDHCGALSQVLSLLKQQTPVYLPSENSFGIREIREVGGLPVICHEPIEFVDGVMSTGEVPGGLSEHSLLINVKGELVVLTGCSHPGLVNILKRAQKVSGIEKMHAVIGGFHISGINEGLKMGEFLRKLNVRLISPCHCTSDDAKQAIAKTQDKRYVKNGAGKIISIG